MADNFQDFAAGAEIVKQFRTCSQDFRTYLLEKLATEHQVLGSSVDDPYAKIKERWLHGDLQGRKIEAIREVRMIGLTPTRSGLPLKEAKDLVESWQ